MRLPFPTAPLPLARGLAIACVLSLLLSPPLTNLLQALILLVVLANGELRQRLRACLRQPMVLGALVFYAILIFAATYSEAPPREAYGMLNGWRKVLLVVLAASLFDEGASKRRVALWFTLVAAGFALVSYVSLWTGTLPIPVRAGELPGTVVRNHATQGMMFAVGAFCAGALWFTPGLLTGRWRPLVAACGLLLLSNVVLVSTGRSGYLVLLACAGSAGLAYVLHARERRGRAVLLSGVGLLVLAALLFLSPRSREGIDRGIRESQTYEQQQGELTSMGIRQYFWRNTLTLIAQRPVLGHGTASFERVYGKLVAGRPGVAGTPSSDPHQQFLKIAAEQGLLGLAVFLGFLAMALRQRATMPWRLLGLGVLLAWCLTSLANSHFSTFAEGTFIYLWMGIMLAGEKRDPESPGLPPARE